MQLSNAVKIFNTVAKNSFSWIEGKIVTCFWIRIFIDDPFRFFLVIEDIVDPIDGEALVLDEWQRHKLKK